MTPDQEKEYGPRPKLTCFMSASEGAKRPGLSSTDEFNPQDFVDESVFSDEKEDKIDMNPITRVLDSGETNKIYFHYDQIVLYCVTYVFRKAIRRL